MASTHHPPETRPTIVSIDPVEPRQRVPIRVASVPASHVYVRHLASPDGSVGVVRLPDVPPADGAKVPGGWWPPVMLDADWIGANHATFDVFHVHFGFDAKHPDELRDVVAALDDAGVPLVVTVHDLRNPHHHDRALHDEQLGVLVQAATEVLTLTPGARREIGRRWGRDATVVEHPHVVSFERMRRGRRRSPQDGFVVGMHAKSVRANMDPVAVADALADVVAPLRDARLQIDLHDELLDPGNHWYDPDTVHRLRAVGHGRADVDVRIHPYFSDDELWDYLESLDVSVLPYRFGTHSGWLEACHDLGTAVIAPDCGFYAEQSGCRSYHHGDDGLDVESLHAAVRQAYGSWRRQRDGVAGSEFGGSDAGGTAAGDGGSDDREVGAVDGGPAGGQACEQRIAARYRQRLTIAAAHDEIYRRVLQRHGRSAVARGGVVPRR